MGCIKRNVIRNILTADSWFRWLKIDVRKLQKQDCDYCHFVPAVRWCTNDLGKKKTGYCHFVLTVCIGDLGKKKTGYCHFVLTVCISDLGKKKTGYCHFVLTVCISDLGKKKTVITAILCWQSVSVTLVKRRLVTAILCWQSVSVTLVKRRLWLLPFYAHSLYQWPWGLGQNVWPKYRKLLLFPCSLCFGKELFNMIAL